VSGRVARNWNCTGFCCEGIGSGGRLDGCGVGAGRAGSASLPPRFAGGFDGAFFGLTNLVFS
jgi:hypothetical protein